MESETDVLAEDVKELEKIEQILTKEYKPKLMEFSENIGELAGALAKAQGAMVGVEKGKEGYGYRYADLSSVIDTLREPLATNGVSYTQGHYFLKIDGKPYVGTETLMMHSSGQWIKTTLEIPMPQMKQLQPAQLMGVVATYGRRYLLQAIAGLASEDTDGVVK